MMMKVLLAVCVALVGVVSAGPGWMGNGMDWGSAKDCITSLSKCNLTMAENMNMNTMSMQSWQKDQLCMKAKKKLMCIMMAASTSCDKGMMYEIKDHLKTAKQMMEMKGISCDFPMMPDMMMQSGAPSTQIGIVHVIVTTLAALLYTRV